MEYYFYLILYGIAVNVIVFKYIVVARKKLAYHGDTNQTCQGVLCKMYQLRPHLPISLFLAVKIEL